MLSKSIFYYIYIFFRKNRIKVVELLLKYHASVEATTEYRLFFKIKI